MHFLLTNFNRYMINIRWLGVFRTCSSLNQYVEVPSALHLLYKHRENIFQTVSPYLSNFDYFDDIRKLHTELRLRGINMSVESLTEMKRNCELQAETSQTVQSLKMERNETGKQASLINDSNRQSEKALLLQKIHDYSEQILSFKEKMQELENNFILPFLNLPNRLHQSTTHEDVELSAHFQKPTLTSDAKSHLTLCLRLKEILTLDVSPNSCYLVGNLAILELAVTAFVLNHAKRLGFKALSVTDFAKAVLAEGCGFDLKNEEIFEIYERDCVSSSLKTYLVGGTAAPCSVALICKLVKNPNFVKPFKSVSVGRKYASVELSQSVNLYNTLQATAASAFILYSNHSKEENKLLNEAITLVTEIYTELGLHFKLVRYAACKLKKHESLAVGICMFSPFTKSYVEVGRISLCSDYISRRLQCIEGLGQKKGAFLGMIHLEIINITKWIACMVENTQTSAGNYLIPLNLEPFMFDAECSYL